MCCVVVAQDRASYNPQSARQMGIASIVFSVLGIVVMVIVIIVIVVLFVIGVQVLQVSF